MHDSNDNIHNTNNRLKTNCGQKPSWQAKEKLGFCTPYEASSKVLAEKGEAEDLTFMLR